MYANTYIWIYTCMPECMREGTDQMDNVWQWKSLLMVINVKQYDSISSSEEWEWSYKMVLSRAQSQKDRLIYQISHILYLLIFCEMSPFNAMPVNAYTTLICLCGLILIKFSQRNIIFQVTFFVVMYRYGAMVINLARRGYCNAGVCISVWMSVGMCLCICVSAAQYSFVKCGKIVTKLYKEITGYICWIPGGSILKIYWWGLHWHIKKGVLITDTTRNRGWGLSKKRGSHEQLLHTCADISRFVMLVSIRWRRLPSIPGIIWKQNTRRPHWNKNSTYNW